MREEARALVVMKGDATFESGLAHFGGVLESRNASGDVLIPCGSSDSGRFCVGLFLAAQRKQRRQ